MRVRTLTPGLVAQIVADSFALSGTAFDPALLLSEGGYAAREGGYWVPSGRVVFDAAHFYVPVEAVDAFGNHAFVTWDAFTLLVTSTRDSLNNVVSADNDYRVLAPRLVTDANLNRIESSFDALGLLVRAAVMGKVVETEGDTIESPTTELQYDLFRWLNEGEPARIHTSLREEHASDNAASRLQHSYTYSDGFGRVVMQKVQAEPGEVPGMSGLINPRWVGTGRTIFNNKGNPVKQYEPFFSATSDYESEDSVVEFGVTPIIHYDPVGRVIRTEYPDGSSSKVVFDAWSEENWDQSDTVLESSWYQERGAPSPTGPEPGDPVTRSAWLAAQHAATPTVTHLDTLGRVFSSFANNRTNGVDAEYQTKTQLDIEGNTLAIFDARQIDLNPGSPFPTITQTFDVLQRRLKLVSADAGTRLSVADAAGKPLRSWDSRGQTLRSRYDALQRGTHDYVRKAGSERLLVRTVYGEALDPALAQQNNLRGKAYQVYDCAGLVTSNAYDFKGNLLSASRRLAVAYATEPDWIAAQALSDPSAILNAVASLLQSEIFTTTTAYDALNRVTRMTAPDGAASATRIVYNEASLIDSIHVAVRGAAESPVVSNIDYNARGQRTRCDYQNGSVTTYQYDPRTFRVTELRTLRMSDGKLLQLLGYTYDPVGNITDVRDASNWDTALNNLAASGITGHGRYTYDALYRLVSATGREHPALQTDDADPPRYALPHGNDLQQLRSYVEKLSYDQVGNILEMRHLTGPSNSQSWSRRYQYATNSNRLLATSAAGDPNGTYSLSYGYAPGGSNDAGAHGSMTSMPHLAALEWDYADRLKHTLKSIGSTQNTYFTYDASGERVRKVYLHDGVVEERIYLGGYEVYRRHSGSVTAAVQLERQTLHIMDGARCILLIETKTVDTINGDAAPLNTPRRRYQLDNHLGSSALELNDTAQAISYEEYHPYGSTAFHSASSAVAQKRYRYTGKEKDDETGLYYRGARYYAPWLGRWTAADPIGVGADINVYAYVRGNPTVRSDPTGMWDWEEFGGGVLAGAGAVALGIIVVAAFATGVGEVALAVGASAALAESLSTGVVVGAAVVGAFSTGVKAGEVITGETISGEKLTDAQRSRMAGEATVEGLAILGGGKLARSRAASEKAADRSMIEGLVNQRKAMPTENQGRTLASGRTGEVKTPVRESVPQGEHAEPKVLNDLSGHPNAGRDGQVVAVDQLPCESCAPKLANELPPGSKVIVPKLQAGEPPSALASKQPPGTSPKQAAKKAATGKSRVEPHTIMQVPRSPAQVGRRTPPPGGLLLWPAWSPGPKDERTREMPPPPQTEAPGVAPILEYRF